MKKHPFGLLIFLLLLWSCQKDESTLPAEEKMSLRANQSFALADGNQVTVSQINESRCPSGARCLRFGSVVVRLGLSGQGQTTPAELCLGECRGTTGGAAPLNERDSVDLSLAGQRYRVVLTDVLPYPGIPGNPGVDTTPQSALLTVKRL
jgi:hypothetical protein